MKRAISVYGYKKNISQMPVKAAGELSVFKDDIISAVYSTL